MMTAMCVSRVVGDAGDDGCHTLDFSSFFDYAVDGKTYLTRIIPLNAEPFYIGLAITE